MKLELKGAGFTRRRQVEVDSHIEVPVLLKLVEEELRVSDRSRVKLVFKGKRLPSTGYVDFKDGDSLFVIVAPKAPPSYIQQRDEDDDDLTLEVAPNASSAERWLVHFLKHKLGIPELLLVVILNIGLKRWLLFLSWLIIAHFAIRWDIFAIYILVTILSVILFNLGKRREGELSAYSIFNDNFEEIPGTFNAERLDRDLRAGLF